MPKRDEVRAAMMVAARNIIEDEGHERVSVRSLAERTAYSSSSVGQYVLPMERFMFEVWLDVHRECIREPYIELRPQPDWAPALAASWLDWARRHPRTATFYVGFLPALSDLALEAHHAGVEAAAWAASDGALGDAWHSSTRRVQASCGLALTQDRTTAQRLLADDFAEIDVRWQRVVATLTHRPTME
jgi:hypothetical protein